LEEERRRRDEQRVMALDPRAVVDPRMVAHNHPRVQARMPPQDPRFTTTDRMISQQDPRFTTTDRMMPPQRFPPQSGFRIPQIDPRTGMFDYRMGMFDHRLSMVDPRMAMGIVDPRSGIYDHTMGMYDPRYAAGDMGLGGRNVMYDQRISTNNQNVAGGSGMGIRRDSSGGFKYQGL
jgi:hypothetical protein